MHEDNLFNSVPVRPLADKKSPVNWNNKEYDLLFMLTFCYQPFSLVNEKLELWVNSLGRNMVMLESQYFNRNTLPFLIQMNRCVLYLSNFTKKVFSGGGHLTGDFYSYEIRIIISFHKRQTWRRSKCNKHHSHQRHHGCAMWSSGRAG